MQFEITHATEYAYSDKVFFEPHYFRFKPKSTPYSAVKEFSMSIEPTPSGLSEQIDIENNYISFGWFKEMHARMKITSHSIVEVEEHNPFNFIVHPKNYLKLPFEYNENLKQLLKPSLNPLLTTENLSKEVVDYRNEVLRNTSHHTIEFLLELTKKIHRDFSLYIRETGDPFSPNHTFTEKSGSCRDLAWMQIHMLRELGMAARFVSGYFYLEMEDETKEPEFELHAWVEAYLPGAGWIGFDPSHGILVSGFHIPVASSAFFENTMPVSGTTRGPAKSELKHELNIKKYD